MPPDRLAGNSRPVVLKAWQSHDCKRCFSHTESGGRYSLQDTGECSHTAVVAKASGVRV